MSLLINATIQERIGGKTLDQRLTDKFAAQLDSMDAWVKSYLDAAEIRPNVRGLAESMRRYISHCRRRLKRGEARISDITRWREKLERVSIALWQAAQAVD